MNYENWQDKERPLVGARGTPRQIEAAIDHIQNVVAYELAAIIDAGSERDAVIEDDDLRAAIEILVTDWIEIV